MRFVVIFLMAVAALLQPAMAQDKMLFDKGPAVGTAIPHGINTLDAQGTPQSFESLKGTQGVALFFVRSVDWCPYCQRQVIDINNRAAELEALGFRVVALSYDSLEKQQKFIAKRDINFTMLSDPNSEIIDAFALRNPGYAKDHYAYGVPYPAIFLLDTEGVIRAKFLEESYKNRPKLDDVIAVAGQLAKS